MKEEFKKGKKSVFKRNTNYKTKHVNFLRSLIDVNCNMQNLERTYTGIKNCPIYNLIKFHAPFSGDHSTLNTISDSLTYYKSNLKTDKILILSKIKIF